MKKALFITHSKRDGVYLAAAILLMIVCIAADLSPVDVVLRLMTWALVIGIAISLLVFGAAILINLCGRLLRSR